MLQVIYCVNTNEMNEKKRIEWLHFTMNTN